MNRNTIDDLNLINYPLINDEYTSIDDGITNIYLIVYNDINAIIYNQQTHLFLDGVFVSDDTHKEKKEYDNSIGIDELINEQLDNDVYSNHYFPNFTSGKFKHDDVNKYMSIPLITSIKLGSYDMTFEYKKFPKYWNCTYMDLNENGKSFYKTIKDIYQGKEVKILTFVNNIF